MQDRFSPRHLKIAAVASAVYLTWVVGFVGFRPDHLYFLGFLLLCYFATSSTRLLMGGFIFYIIYWVIYDGMRVIPNFEVNPVHIAQPYDLEKMLFGIQVDGARLTPNEYWAQNLHPALDFIAGISYLSWVPLPMLFSLYLLKTDREMLIRFSASFLFANLVGFVIYYLYPAAPPWYYAAYGNVESFDIPGSAAYLVRFDELVGLPIFTNMYTKNANVFAAIPSLHAAYPLILTYYGFKARLKWMHWLFALTIIGIWFGALYSSHHYLIDLLLGAFCAFFAIFVFEKFLMKGRVGNFLKDYALKLSA